MSACTVPRAALRQLVEQYDSVTSSLHVPRVELEFYEAVCVRTVRCLCSSSEHSPREAASSSVGGAASPAETEDEVILYATAAGAAQDEDEPRERHRAPSAPRDARLSAPPSPLACLGALFLLLEAFLEHQRRTVAVLACADEREAVLDGLVQCCSSYDYPGSASLSASSKAARGGRQRCSLEEAQQNFLLLLQEHQLTTVLAVEALFHWRAQLSRPYAFRTATTAAAPAPDEDGNYLLRILQDCQALTRSTVGQSLSLHLDQFPCCSNTDVTRTLRRRQLMHRARLLNSGALLRGVPARSSSPAPLAVGGLAAHGSDDGNADADVDADAGQSSASASGQSGRRDYSTRMAHERQRFAGEDASADAFANSVDAKGDPTAGAASMNNSRASNGSSGGGGSSFLARARKEKHSRLQAAERLICLEASVQSRLTMELLALASEQDCFVPLLVIPGLFVGSPAPETGATGSQRIGGTEASREPAGRSREDEEDSTPSRSAALSPPPRRPPRAGPEPASLAVPMEPDAWRDVIALNEEHCVDVARRQLARHAAVLRRHRDLEARGAVQPTTAASAVPHRAAQREPRLSVDQRAAPHARGSGHNNFPPLAIAHGARERPKSTARPTLAPSGSKGVGRASPPVDAGRGSGDRARHAQPLPYASSSSSSSSTATTDICESATASGTSARHSGPTPSSRTSRGNSTRGSRSSSESSSSRDDAQPSRKLSQDESLELLRQQLLAERRASSQDASMLSL